MISQPTLISDLAANSEFDQFKKQILADYWTCVVSREASIMARKEVLTGKAKFGIVGDGKELPQVVMNRYFEPGDWRSGYYRDQTFAFASGTSTVEDFFAQLYADTDNDPFSGGRQMNSHYATSTINEDGEWLDHTDKVNISADISCTGGQAARALGLALASKLYRNRKIEGDEKFTKNGNEIVFCTIGDSSTSEGVFWETMNAAAVMKVPLVMAVWDDGYGISVPKELQTAKGSISEAMEGLLVNDKGEGVAIFKAKGWDYQELNAAFEKATELARREHIPALVHVEELTQPQGHSTSGSHERYKSKERLDWEKAYDCNLKMREWILLNSFANEEELEALEVEAKEYVKTGKQNAWAAFVKPLKELKAELTEVLAKINDDEVQKIKDSIQNYINPNLSEIYAIGREAKIALVTKGLKDEQLNSWIDRLANLGVDRYQTNLYSDTKYSALYVPVVHPTYSDDSPKKNGYMILNDFFDKTLAKRPEVIAFGEDVGHIGDVNQGFAGLQEKYGDERVFDTGIREWTIIGQGIGAAARGLRPIAEIQYLDYLAYAFSPLTDDLATLRYRSNGIQKAPLIVRTRGHRLEGIWHAGSPMGVLTSAMRGIYVCVPRNMVQAAGMYNTLLQSDDPAIVIECLNGYRLKERVPENMGEYTVPLGSPEVLQQGDDITIVSYGSTLREVQKANELLIKAGISAEIIDIQTLLPFDLEQTISHSLAKTNRLLIVDEDVPGGGSAYILQEIIEKQKGYRFLDSEPRTLSAKAHRTPFGSDGDYFTKPQPEDVFDVVYEILSEAEPDRF